MNHYYKYTLSIIVPIYNASIFLRKCLDSIICYELNNYEIILVNDGSTDDSVVICTEYCNKYSFIHLIEKDNGGVSSARNIGLQTAQGKWVFFVDSDDYLEDDALKILLSSLDDHTSLLQFRTSKVYIDGTKERRSDACTSGIYGMKDYQNKNLFKPELWNYCFKKNIIDILHLKFDETLNYAEDQLFILSYFTNNEICIKIIENYIYNYVITPTSATQKVVSAIILSQNLKAISKMLQISNDIIYKKIYYETSYSLFKYYIRKIIYLNYGEVDLIYSQKQIRSLIKSNLISFRKMINIYTIGTFLSLKTFVRCYKKLKKI